MEQKITAPRRLSGILVHPTSFPSPYGIGDLGQTAYDFIDFLKKAGQSLWQCLPLGPTGFGDSPYQAYSAFAGQPLLISPDKLIELNLLCKDDVANVPEWNKHKVEYTRIVEFKTKLLKIAHENFLRTSDAILMNEYETFCKEHDFWLTDYALFMALKDHQNGKKWTEWDIKYKTPTESTKKQAFIELEPSVNYYCFVQFIFFKQWYELKKYANANDIQIIGDIPIFVSPDSADAWANKELFQLDDDGYPTVIAGVPPDYFSKTGQMWGNPLYNWEYHKKTGYTWWIARIRHQLTQTDIFRIDHFRGFEAYWAIPANAETAISGKWIKGPGNDFFDHILESFEGETLPIIAEDLGIITPEVEALRDAYDLPGMKILQFAFNELGDGAYYPYNYVENCVCYTGTHDNDTTVGWYWNATPQSQDKDRRYLSCDGKNIHWDMIRLAMGSVARYVVFPLQDVLGLGSDCRMNTPGIGIGNWAWRFQKEDLKDWMSSYLNDMSQVFWRNQKPAITKAKDDPDDVTDSAGKDNPEKIQIEEETNA